MSDTGEDIRDALFNSKEEVEIGDLFTGYKTITTYPDMRHKITNGEDYAVIAKSDKTLSSGDVPGWYVTLKALESETKRDLFFVSPDDYTEFQTQLLPLIEQSHNGQSHHCGKVPTRTCGHDRNEIERNTLNRQLDQAVKNEDYETAAKRRDQIQALT